MKNWLIAIMLSSLPVVAMAGDNSVGGFYLGGGVANVKVDVQYENTSDMIAEEIVGGYKLNPFVGVEARLGVGMKDNADLFYGSAYYRTESSNETAKTYLLLGYTFGVLASDDAIDESVNLSGISYGAGVGFVLTPRLNLNFEYRAILVGSGDFDMGSRDIELSGVSLNVDYRF
ncbi:porin family protein [Cellvibrio sp. OA-2007]|uniref:porin family protein n=1 Tax=Cellvibrio sp. OA-2007 TaxID=529823 RepID=UPI000784B6FD|nr:porin family protein [Cellvibrio sp. OA-2007]